MLDASSYGRGAPKPKTINVQANLLAQRNAERERVRAASKRRLVSLLVVVGLASVVLPPSWGASDRVAKLADESAAKNATVHAELRDLQMRQQNLKPILDQMAVQERIRGNAKMMLGEMATLLNAANPQVAFSGVRAEAHEPHRLAFYLNDVAAAFLALAAGGLEAFPFVVLALAIAWYANLYNFMDGSDGLAGGMAVIGFGAYALAAAAAGETVLATSSAVVASASLAFLVFNFPPARIFMGDVGSVPLGFLAGALGVLGWHAGAWPLWFPVAVFAPFVCDATLTLAKRLARRERVWRAHRDHYYQRLVRMGFGHRGTAWIEYAAMTGCAGAALYARQETVWVQTATLALATAVLVAIAAWVDVRWARHARGGAP